MNPQPALPVTPTTSRAEMSSSEPPATAGSADQQGLAAELRAATAEAHEEAENTPFIRGLLAGRLEVTDYAWLASQLHAVYRVLEDAVAANTDPAVAPFLAPELARLPSLTEDLEHLAGPGWSERFPVLPATEAYRERLREVCFDWPAGLLAHHYIRYMGDLSGGQLLGRVLRRVFGFVDDKGTEFYRFPDVPSPKAFKQRYRRLLDELPWSEQERQRFIDEANRAFHHNTAIFHDLASR